MKSIFIVFSLLAFLILEGCTDKANSIIEQDNSIYEVSGTLILNKPLQNNTKVITIWTIRTSSGDKSYVIGISSVNTSDNTFKLNFMANLPENVLIDSQFAIAKILLTTDQNLKDGDEFTSNNISSIVGGSPDYSLIYIKGKPSAIMYNDWLKKFKTGFNTGKGIRYDSKLDEFEPVPPNSIEIIVDDVKNLKFINWT